MTHLHQHRFYDLDTLLFNCQRSKNFVKSLKLVVEFSLNNQPYSFTMVEVNGIEPMTSCVQGRRSPS